MTALYIASGSHRAVPFDVLLSAIPSLPRAALARLVDRAIDRMDEEDGDPDLEPNGDELDETDAEDAFHAISRNYAGIYDGPGCPIADPDIEVDSEGEQTDEREPEEYEGGACDRWLIQARGNAPPMFTA